MKSPKKGVSGLTEIGLFGRFSTVMVLVVLLVLFASGSFMINRQQAILYQEEMNGGKLVLNYVANNASIPLLEEDVLSLNTLVKQAMVRESFLYVMIVDDANLIKAHTDLSRIEKDFNDYDMNRKIVDNENIASVTYSVAPDGDIMELSKPISYMDRTIGSAHLGLSLEYINKVVKKETVSLIHRISYLGIFMVLIVMGASLFFARRSYRQISKSISLTQEMRRKALLPQMRRNQVTVLFAGIKGFKAHANDRDAEEVLNELNEYFSVASHCILDFGGYIDKFVGDAVIGVFEDSPFIADHTQSAVTSAVAIQKALETAGENGNPLPCKVGIGISSGVALCGLIGSPNKREYTFIGESFKTAYSLYLMAGPGEIMISKDVYQSIQDSVSVEPVPPLEMTKTTESWKNFRVKRIAVRK